MTACLMLAVLSMFGGFYSKVLSKLAVRLLACVFTANFAWFRFKEVCV